MYLLSLAFNIHPPDTLNPNVFVDGAPSRPPSRNNTRGVDAPVDVGKLSPPYLNLQYTRSECPL